MRIRTRLLLGGVLLPAAAIAASVFLGGWLFERTLLEELDHELRGEGEIEAVSLFDGEAEPHLHEGFSSAPLETLRTIYDGKGAVRLRSGPALDCPPPAAWPEGPRFVDHGAHHELILPVRAEDGRPFYLSLCRSLAPLRATVTSFRRATGAAGAIVIVLLLVLQLRLSSRLAARIEGLAGFMRRLRGTGELGAPPPDGTPDELGELRDAIAIATERLAAAREQRERFVADAAHELRTPLAVTLAELDVLLRHPRSAEDLTRGAERVRKQMRDIAALAARLLEAAATDRARWKMVDGDLAATLAERAARQAGAAEARGVRLAVELPPIARARFDPEAMGRVLDNLVDNALGLAPASSTVRVGLRRAETSWRLEVEDEGPGVPEEEREEIFRPFRRRDRTRPGAGLGLSIVRDIVSQHEGSVFVEAGAKGARFVVELPAL